MQRIQDAARAGYGFYFLGQVEEKKWAALEAKFERRYGTDMAKSTRSKRRKSGEAVALLYACPPPPYGDDRRVVFVLMATEGRGRIHGAEDLSEFRHRRLELDGYELVHDGKCWTWQMSQARYRYWRERIHSVAARRPGWCGIDGEAEVGVIDPDAETIQDALYNAPGFRLVRRQIGYLVHFLRAEWKRLRPATGAQLRERSFLPYVQRLPNKR